jgi:hypothetical protein
MMPQKQKDAIFNLQVSRCNWEDIDDFSRPHNFARTISLASSSQLHPSYYNFIQQIEVQDHLGFHQI